MKPSLVAVLSAVLVLGCDRLGERGPAGDAAARQESERRQAQEEHERFARSLTECANGRLKLVQARRAELTRDVGAWRADVDQLAGIVRKGLEEKTAQGKDVNHETRLLNLLRNPDVNALARKHLAADFSAVQGEFVERVRAAREDEASYRKARAQSEANYTASIQEANKWVNASVEQRDAEVKRLRGEVAALEQRRAREYRILQDATKKTLVGNVSQERERRERIEVMERKIIDMDGEIAVKRRQVDYLRNPDANRGIASRAANHVQHVQDRANTIRQQNLRDIDSYYKPKETVTEVVSAWSAKTIGKLQSVLAEKVRDAEKQLSVLSERERAVKEILLAIPVSDLGELKQLRAKVVKLD